MTLTTPSTSAAATTIPAPALTVNTATSAGVADAPTSMSSAATQATTQAAEGNCFSSICDCLVSLFHLVTCGCFRGPDAAAVANENVQFHERMNGLRNLETRPLEHEAAFVQLYKDALPRHKETVVQSYQTTSFNKLAASFNAEETAALQGRPVADFAQFRQNLIARKVFNYPLDNASSVQAQFQAATAGRPLADVKNVFNDYFAQVFYRHQTNAGSQDALVGEMRQLTQSYLEIASR